MFFSLEFSFEAILVELPLLLDFLVVLWFLPLLVKCGRLNSFVNNVSVCYRLAHWSWISNTGNRTSWPQRICAVCYLLQSRYLLSLGLVLTHPVEVTTCTLNGERNG